MITSNNYGFRYESLLFIPALLGTVIGIPGTILTMRFYGRRIKKESKSTALFLTSLAVFDMLSLLTTIPTAATAITLSYVDGWKESSASSIEIYISRIPKYWSNMMLLLVGIERVVCVVLPHKISDIFTRRVGIVSIILVIIIGPVALFPLSIAPPIVVVPNNGTITHVHYKTQTLIDPDVYSGLVSLGSVLYFGIPITGVVICNLLLVIVLLYRYKSKHSTNVRNTMTPSQVKELRTTKLVMIVTIVFIVCVCPLMVIFPIILNSGEAIPIGSMLVLAPISNLLETLNNSMNAVVYYIGSSNFRTETRETLSRICCCFKQATITPMVELTAAVESETK